MTLALPPGYTPGPEYATSEALWETARAQSLAYSNHDTAVYEAALAARPGGVWSNAPVPTSVNGSAVYSGSVSPGTYFDDSSS